MALPVFQFVAIVVERIPRPIRKDGNFMKRTLGTADTVDGESEIDETLSGQAKEVLFNVVKPSSRSQQNDGSAGSLKIPVLVCEIHVR